MDEWQLFHAYRHLANEGKVKHLTCPDCDTKLITVLGQDDRLELWCASHDTRIVPGIDLRDRVRAVVREHINE